MLRQLAIESGIVVTLTSLLLGLAATVGLPGRPDRPARAAEATTAGTATSQASWTGRYLAAPEFSSRSD
jgi:hypothetical protein